MRKILYTEVAALALLAPAAVTTTVASAAAKPPPKTVVLLNTFSNNQANVCAARPINGGTTNGYGKEAESFTVTHPAEVTKVVLPLSIEGAASGKIKVTVVSGQPSTFFWTSIPDESARLGRAATARVSTRWTPCGAYQVVTARFTGKPVKVSPGSIYWIVLQNPPRRTNTFYWYNAVGSDTSTTFAIYLWL